MSATIIEFMTSLQRSEQQAYAAGYDCGMNGADIHNCDFRFFGSRALTAAWEDGQREAKRCKTLPQPPAEKGGEG